MKPRFDPLILVPALTWMYRAWRRSFRFHCPERAVFQQVIDTGVPMVVALWHEELLPLISWGLSIRMPAATIVSDSKDGEIIARVLEAEGFGIARGSSTRGGLKALVGGIRLIRDEKRNLAFTVDGPRGPRGQVKEGALFVASKAGAAILPIRARVEWKKVFERSWDHFQLPLPFSRILVRAGEPFWPGGAPGAELTKETMAVEQERLAEALRALGRDWDPAESAESADPGAGSAG